MPQLFLVLQFRFSKQNREHIILYKQLPNFQVGDDLSEIFLFVAFTTWAFPFIEFLRFLEDLSQSFLWSLNSGFVMM